MVIMVIMASGFYGGFMAFLLRHTESIDDANCGQR